MNAADTIQAAIDKLTDAKAKSTQGPWYAWHPANGRGNSSVDAPSCDDDNPNMAVEGEREDVDLIVVLHRTIDAQLKILHGTARLHTMYVAVGREPEWLAAVERAGDLDLARAILGDDK